jgi:hypothetical protein
VLERQPPHGFVNCREGCSLVAVAEKVSHCPVEREHREAFDLDHVFVPETALMHDQAGAGSDAPRVGHCYVDIPVIDSGNTMQRKGSSTGQRYRWSYREQCCGSSRRQLEQVGGVHDNTPPRLGEHASFQPLEDFPSPEKLIGLPTRKHSMSPRPIDHKDEDEAPPSLTERALSPSCG